jgi:cell division inhibitor SulA
MLAYNSPNSTYPSSKEPSTTLNTLSTLQRDSSELTLLKVLLQHRSANGWIVLVAPQIKPVKAFWQACHLPLERIILVHPTNQSSLSNTILTALSNNDCKVVINCRQLSDAELARCQQVAIQHGKVLHTLADSQQQTH